MINNNFYIAVRHGEVDKMGDSILGSGTDIHLNETGIIQSHLLAGYISSRLPNLNLIVSSPLTRAMQTSEIISSNYPKCIPIVQMPELQAQGFGILEGERVSTARTQDKFKPYLYEFISEEERYESAPPGGESLKNLADRSEDFFRRFGNTFSPNGILFVTHQSVLRAIHGRLKNIPPQQWDSKISVPYSDCLAISPKLDKILQGSLSTNIFNEI